MKTASLPSLRVDPELRREAEGVLKHGESLSGLVEQSVRDTIRRRKAQQEFIARGLAGRDEAKRTGDYIDADQVIAALSEKLAARAGPQG
jgi:predicted transcriptional regulator